MISFGFSASARAMPMRWRWPPENSCGYRPAWLGDSPTSVSSSATRSRAACSARDAVHRQHFHEHRPHAEARVEARVRILKDDLHLPPQPSHLAIRQRGQFLPFELDAAFGGFDQPEHAASGGRLAAPAFADQTQHFTGLHRKRHAVYGAHLSHGPGHQPLLDGKVLLEAFHHQEAAAMSWLRRPARRRTSGCATKVAPYCFRNLGGRIECAGSDLTGAPAARQVVRHVGLERRQLEAFLNHHRTPRVEAAALPGKRAGFGTVPGMTRSRSCIAPSFGSDA